MADSSAKKVIRNLKPVERKLYTLSHLTDLALRSPEVGAVNFNLLRVLLQNILFRTNLENITVNVESLDRYSDIREQLDTPSVPEQDEGEKTTIPEQKKDEARSIPDSEKVQDMAEEKELKLETKVKDFERKDSRRAWKKQYKTGDAAEKVDILSVKEKKAVTPDIKLHKEVDDKHGASPAVEIKRLTGILKKAKRKKTKRGPTIAIPKEMKGLVEDDISDEELDGASESEGSQKSTKEKSLPPVREETTGVSKSIEAGKALWQIWEIRKLKKKIEALEEQYTRTVVLVDELNVEKQSRLRRIKERGEKNELGREEFEDALEEMGDTITSLASKIQKQNEKTELISQEILNEISTKATEEQVSQINNYVQEKIKALGLAVRCLQGVVKEMLYPEAPGVTKCMGCGRKAHLPMMDQLFKKFPVVKKNINLDKKKIQLKTLREQLDKEHGIKDSHASFAKSRENDISNSIERKDQTIQVNGCPVQTMEVKRDVFTNLEEMLDTLYTLDESMQFPPLRIIQDPLRQTISVPAIRQSRPHLTLSVVNS